MRIAKAMNRKRPQERKGNLEVVQKPKAKKEQDPIRMVPLDTIKPHWLNDRIYGPVDPKDPEAQALAESIKEYGLRESLVLTSDLYLLSGHRRRVAASLAGLQSVPCQIEDFDAHDPRVPILLATYNRQRVKTADAILREKFVLANQEDAYQQLTVYRQQRANLGDVETIDLEDERRRSKISPAKRPFLEAVLHVLKEYRRFRPLTDRQIHYALLNHPPLIHASKPHSRYANNQRCYKRLCDLLTRARLRWVSLRR
jgi:hypothetical protein